MALLKSFSRFSSTLWARSLRASSVSYNSRHFASAHAANAQQSVPAEARHLLYKQALLDRSIIKLFGAESRQFLQQIITNDVQLLFEGDTPRKCIYAFLLGVNGRIDADMFVYRSPQCPDEFLLEVDSAAVENVVQLIKRYRIRRKVWMKPYPECTVSVIFPSFPDHAPILPLENPDIQDETKILTADPRSAHFGYRAISVDGPITNLPTMLLQQNEGFTFTTMQSCDSAEYRTFRYHLGVGEGVLDFPRESVLPLEANADLLNAVSFTKGCYVGQELTARTYHTGVLRKRYVPVELIGRIDTEFPTQNVVIKPEDEDAYDDDARPRIMGRFRANFGNLGLASLKYAEVFGTPESREEQGILVPSKDQQMGTLMLANSGCILRARRPIWWPDSI